jgi:hypothetical protein
VSRAGLASRELSDEELGAATGGGKKGRGTVKLDDQTAELLVRIFLEASKGAGPKAGSADILARTVQVVEDLPH